MTKTVVVGCTVHHADCIDVMRGMAADSVEAVVCDPPYGLSDHKPEEVVACLTAWLAGEEYRPKARGGFMGRSWDAWVPGPEVWREVIRVLRPGGHACVFAGTRSLDLMSMALRLAGFELRDSIGSMSDGGGAPLLAFVYGTGFPKSHSIEKAIDRMRDDDPAWRTVGAWLKARRGEAGTSAKAVCAAIGAHGDVNHGGALSNWENGFSCPTWDQWLALKALFGFGDEMDAEVWRLNGRKGQPGEAWHEREVIERRADGAGNGSVVGLGSVRSMATEYDVTVPATDAAKRWAGWGSALKPAWEPILLCRKPLSEPTLAANVLKHTTGALNIDACRVPYVTVEGGTLAQNTHLRSTIRAGAGFAPGQGTGDATRMEVPNATGRWPPNLVTDGSAGTLAAFATFGERKSRPGATKMRGESRCCYGAATITDGPKHDDTGTAVRFFPALGFGEEELSFHYSAKANKRDRAGSKHPTVKPQSLLKWLARLTCPPDGTILDPFAGSGSLGQAAIAEGFKAILIERELEYYEDCIRRMEACRPPADLFTEPAA